MRVANGGTNCEENLTHLHKACHQHLHSGRGFELLLCLSGLMGNCHEPFFGGKQAATPAFLPDIDSEEQEVRVQFDQRQVTYDYADLNEVDLAWAVTIHKSQGSEYPVVMLPLFPQHYLMLFPHPTYAIAFS